MDASKDACMDAWQGYPCGGQTNIARLAWMPGEATLVITAKENL